MKIQNSCCPRDRRQSRPWAGLYPGAAGRRRAQSLCRGARPASIKQAGVQPIRLDVTKPEEVAAAARDLGDVTLVINNAGIFRGAGFLSDNGLEAARRRVRDQFFGPAIVAARSRPSWAATAAARS